MTGEFLNGPLEGDEWDGPPNPVLYIAHDDGDRTMLLDDKLVQVVIYIRTDAGDYRQALPPPRLVQVPDTFPEEWTT